MKHINAVITAIISVIVFVGGFIPATTSFATEGTQISADGIAARGGYDVDEDGLTTSTDYRLIKRSVVCKESGFCVADLVRVRKYLVEANGNKGFQGSFVLSDSEVSEENDELLKSAHYNSDYKKKLRIDAETGDVCVRVYDGDYGWDLVVENSYVTNFEYTEFPEGSRIVVCYDVIDVSGVTVYVWENHNYINVGTVVGNTPSYTGPSTEVIRITDASEVSDALSRANNGKFCTSVEYTDYGACLHFQSPYYEDVVCEVQVYSPDHDPIFKDDGRTVTHMEYMTDNGIYLIISIEDDVWCYTLAEDEEMPA